MLKTNSRATVNQGAARFIGAPSAKGGSEPAKYSGTKPLGIDVQTDHGGDTRGTLSTGEPPERTARQNR
ncbi:MAG TPA: hypothetical protein EYQ83_06060 [Acidobacteria bacterium]|nr:hypothetical protein [Acidobacteriota bacterium]